MYEQLSPSDFYVEDPFRWRGVLLAKGSGLPNDMPQGVIRSFVRKGLIGAKNGKRVGTSATRKRSSAKKATKKTKKKARRR